MDQDSFRFKPRTYLHFDSPISRAAAWELASDPKQVASHSFYPFIGFTLKTPRVKRENGKLKRKLKKREIKIAAHRDAAIYSYYGQSLAESYEREVLASGLGDTVTAFRSLPGGGTNVDFANEVFQFIRRNRPCVALVYDVEGFFDTLDHGLLRNEWAQMLGVPRLPDDHFAVFRSLTKFSWVHRGDAFAAFGISRNKPKGRVDGFRICSPQEFRDSIRNRGRIRANPREGKGIPQGSPMSAVVSNIYMLPFDRAINQYVTSLGGMYRRYCDDIMIVVSPAYAAAVDEFVHAQIEARRLTLHEKKKGRVEFDAAPHIRTQKLLQYLGFTFDGVHAFLRLGSLTRYYGKMRRGVSLAKQTQRRYNRLEGNKGRPLSGLRCRKLYLQYTYLYGRRRSIARRNPKSAGTFLSYAYKAAETLGSPKIKRQLRNHWPKFRAEIKRRIPGQLREP